MRWFGGFAAAAEACLELGHELVNLYIAVDGLGFFRWGGLVAVG